MTQRNEGQNRPSPEHISVQQAEHALEAVGNLLYLLEIDHHDVEHLEAYLLMTRIQMEILNRWFYETARRDPD
jgi:hypothetical protein